MVKNISNSKNSERKRDQKNIVRWIAPLNNIKSVGKKNPPGKKELPKQGARIFPYVSERRVAFRWHGVTIDADALKYFVGFPKAFSARAKRGEFITICK